MSRAQTAKLIKPKKKEKKKKHRMPVDTSFFETFFGYLSFDRGNHGYFEIMKC